MDNEQKESNRIATEDKIILTMSALVLGFMTPYVTGLILTAFTKVL